MIRKRALLAAVAAASALAAFPAHAAWPERSIKITLRATCFPSPGCRT